MYHAPTDLTEALKIAGTFSGKIIAGGTDVFPSAKQGQLPDHLLDLTHIPELKTITHDATGTRIGAAVTWTDIIKADLPPAFDGLKQAAREVGSVQIQNAGTLAGNLCNASPAADGVPPLLALDAEVEIASQSGVRSLPLQDFLLGVRQTALAQGELVRAITLPPIPEHATSAFEKLGSRRYLVISITMTSAVICCDDSGAISDARIAVGACSPVAQRLPALETSLIGQTSRSLRIDPSHLAPLSPIDDVRGTKGFRLDVVATQIERAIQKAVGDG